MRRYLLLTITLIIAGVVVYFAQSALHQASPVILNAAKAATVSDQPGVLHVYLTMKNGEVPNRLVAATSPVAETAFLAGLVSKDIVLPAGSTPSLSSDGVYLQLAGIDGPLDEGRLIPISLEFDQAGFAKTRAVIGGAVDPHAMHNVGAVSAESSSESGTRDPAPELSISVTQEAEIGWALALRTKHFTFAPEVENPVHIPGEGHGHLYLNGLKLQRVYSKEARIGALPSGTYRVEVTLNTNLHLAYVSKGGPVRASAEIIVE